MSTSPVFLVAELPTGEHTMLDGAEGRHAMTVRRLRRGEELLLTDGRGNTARCEVEGAHREGLRLKVLQRLRHPRPRPRIVLAQALVKGDRGELAVELATEAGVDAVVPWRALRCVARWEEGPREIKALARWRAAAATAAKQARRAWLPEIDEPVNTPRLTEIVRSVVAGGGHALVLHESAKTSIASVPLSDSDDLMLVVGPEGGIAPEELAVLIDAGATAVRLGSTVLRASTAAAVAMGALGVLTRRWTVEETQ